VYLQFFAPATMARRRQGAVPPSRKRFFPPERWNRINVGYPPSASIESELFGNFKWYY